MQVWEKKNGRSKPSRDFILRCSYSEVTYLTYKTEEGSTHRVRGSSDLLEVGD